MRQNVKKRKKHNIANKWDELSFKDKLSYVFACTAFAAGWILTFIAFLIPPMGIIHNSVLWVLGQALLFSGAVIGIGQYYSSQMRNFKADIIDFVADKENNSEETELELENNEDTNI